MVKLPAPPDPDDLEPVDEDIRTEQPILWRIHRATGYHVTGWDQLRYRGPVESMRFDPHLPPPHNQDRGVLYAGLRIPDVVAEVFQTSRTLDRTLHDPYIAGWEPSRPLRLLDLTGTWPIRAGASAAINSGRKDHCRLWAQTIYSAQPDLDGLWHRSSMTGHQIVTLFTNAADSFPTHPNIDVPLSHPGISIALLDACLDIGYRLL